VMAAADEARADQVPGAVTPCARQSTVYNGKAARGLRTYPDQAAVRVPAMFAAAAPPGPSPRRTGDVILMHSRLLERAVKLETTS